MAIMTEVARCLPRLQTRANATIEERTGTATESQRRVILVQRGRPESGPGWVLPWLLLQLWACEMQ